MILDAALNLFTTRGYGATSITDIAEAAGVAVPTIYTSVGKKPQLLGALLNRIDEIAELPALAGELTTTTQPHRVVELEVRITRTFAERCGDVVTALASAAVVEPEMAKVYHAGMERHRAGAQTTVQRLQHLSALRPGLEPEAAVAITATLTAHRTWESLVRDHDWTFDQTEAWLISTLKRDLLPPPAQ